MSETIADIYFCGAIVIFLVSLCYTIVGLSFVQCKNDVKELLYSFGIGVGISLVWFIGLPIFLVVGAIHWYHNLPQHKPNNCNRD